MKKIVTSFVIVLGFVGHSQKQVFESPELASLIKSIKQLLFCLCSQITYKRKILVLRPIEIELKMSSLFSRYVYLLLRKQILTVVFKM
jgi:hypothetical protein